MSKTIYSIVDPEGRVYADNFLDPDAAAYELVNLQKTFEGTLALEISTREVDDDAHIVGGV